MAPLHCGFRYRQIYLNFGTKKVNTVPSVLRFAMYSPRRSFRERRFLAGLSASAQ